MSGEVTSGRLSGDWVPGATLVVRIASFLGATLTSWLQKCIRGGLCYQFRQFHQGAVLALYGLGSWASSNPSVSDLIKILSPRLFFPPAIPQGHSLPTPPPVTPQRSRCWRAGEYVGAPHEPPGAGRSATPAGGGGPGDRIRGVSM
jgi:hypothetical protein